MLDHMAANKGDLVFPECCAHCPHLQSITASCDHDLRQTLIREITDSERCPMYSEAKTDAMQTLSDSL